MVIRMEKEEELTNPEEVREIRERAVVALVGYLDTFRPEASRGDSKHALMGPVGKLLSKVTTTREINWGAVKGYVLSIHKQQQRPRGISAEAAERLDEATKEMRRLRDLLSPTRWMKTVEDLDDEVFFGVYKAKLIEQRKGIQRIFQEWLKKEYSSIDELNKLLDPDDRYKSFDTVDDPFSIPAKLNEIVGRFWDERKGKKEG